MSSQRFKTKTHSEVLDYSFQWTHAEASDAASKFWLSSGEQIQSAQVVADPSTGLGISSLTNANSFVSFFAGSGTPGTEYVVANLIATNFGNQAVRSFVLEVNSCR